MGCSVVLQGRELHRRISSLVERRWHSSRERLKVYYSCARLVKTAMLVKHEVQCLSYCGMRNALFGSQRFPLMKLCLPKSELRCASWLIPKDRPFLNGGQFVSYPAVVGCSR